MKRREQLAIVVAGVLAFLLVFAYTSAIADGRARARDTPFRAVLGSERYDALMAGEGGTPHYLGADKRAPDFEVMDRHGERFRLASLRGKVVVLNFWSITCAPCLEELPSLETLAHIAEGWGDVEVVALSADSGWDAVRSVVPPDSRLTHLFDPERRVISGQYGTRLFPETWIIDREGVIRFRYDGALDWSRPVVVDIVDAYR